MLFFLYLLLVNTEVQSQNLGNQHNSWIENKEEKTILNIFVLNGSLNNALQFVLKYIRVHLIFKSNQIQQSQ
jgi:hypothetical protein